MTQEQMIEFMYNKIAGLEDRFQSMEDKMQNMEQDIKDIKVSTQLLERKVTNIGMTLENEVRHNISIIAENHVELNKKLNEVLRRDCERETALIRLNMLETRVRELKEKEGAIA